LALNRERVAVMTVLLVLIDDFRRQDGVGERLRLTQHISHEFFVLADLDVLGIALRNLLENAVRYGAPDKPIDVVIDHDHRIHVLSGGPGIRTEVLTLLRMPFQRGTSIGPGGGLGLAIVDNIMAQLGGSLHLLSPATGRDDGFEAILVFPAEDDPSAKQNAPARSATHAQMAPVNAA
jgi:two-component system, OmpR family, sensor kinase